MPSVVARHYRTGEPMRVSWGAGAPVTVAPAVDVRPDLPLLAPALVDIQVNGYGGLDFSRAEHLREIASILGAYGIARLCPTVITGPEEAMIGALSAIARALDTDPALRPAVPGIHVEGPYISPLDGPRGAHPLAHVRPPDWEHFARLQDAARGRVRIVTLAPELPGAEAFIARATREGIVVSIGHTAADTDAIRRAVDSGARMSTHLGNGLAAMVERHRNPLWPQLAAKTISASFIADGEHLPAETLCAMVAAKGIERAILVSDAVAQAGLPPGRYPGVGGAEVEVLASGRVALAGTPYLAGSGAHLARCVAWAAAVGAVDLTSALEMASRHPARLLGLEGTDADWMVFRPRAGDLDVLLTVRAGEVVHHDRGALD